MKTKIAISMILAVNMLFSQQVSSGFETFTLAPGSAYSPTVSTPFYAAGCKFSYLYDGFWAGGFAYTNIADSSNGTYTNLYGVRALNGYSGSAVYVAAQHGAVLTATGNVRVEGIYVTNTTYAYKVMRYGNSFSKKFGGSTGNDPDYFRLIAKGYRSGVVSDSAVMMLADYTFTNNAQDYVLDTWSYFDLSGLGATDSIRFVLRSTDNGSFGMNTPGFFALDMITTVSPATTGTGELFAERISVFPNPAAEVLNVRGLPDAFISIDVFDVHGALVRQHCSASGTAAVILEDLPSGIFMVRTKQNGVIRFRRIVHQ